MAIDVEKVGSSQMENTALFHFTKTEKRILYSAKCVSVRNAGTTVL